MQGAPIGVFDSGVGGLSVFREVRRTLPGEDLLYVADSGHAPYGNRPSDFVARRAEAIAGFFVSEGAKAIVVACNTATALAIQALRSRFPVAIVAIEPAVKPAARVTRSGVIGILATSHTIASDRLSRLVEEHGQRVRVLMQPCPGLAEQVERAELEGADTEALVARFVTPLIERGADTIVLGCTHYPFLEAVIRKVAGPGVCVVDPSLAVARELHRRLESSGLLSGRPDSGTEHFWTSGDPGQVRRVVALLWGKEVAMRSLPPKFAA
jgi:glutamate racemase